MPRIRFVFPLHGIPEYVQRLKAKALGTLVLGAEGFWVYFPDDATNSEEHALKNLDSGLMAYLSPKMYVK